MASLTRHGSLLSNWDLFQDLNFSNWLKEINNSNFQKKQFNNESEEIEEAKNLLESLEYFNASKKLKHESL